MAVVHKIFHFQIDAPSQPFLSWHVREEFEGASQTFPVGPIVNSGGYIVAAASPATDVFGFATRPGQNTTAGTVRSRFVPAIDGLEFHANFLGAAGIDNVIALPTDLYAAYNLEQATKIPNPGTGTLENGWYVEDSSGTAGARMVGTKTDQPSGTVAGGRVANGDTNGRCAFVVLTGIRSYD